MLGKKWVAFKAWLAAHTHVCLHELSTRAGLLVAGMATVLPNFAGFDVRIAYLAAAAGVVLVLIKPQEPSPSEPAQP